MIIDFNLYLTFNVFIQNAANSVRDDRDFSFHSFLTEHTVWVGWMKKFQMNFFALYVQCTVWLKGYCTSAVPEG